MFKEYFPDDGGQSKILYNPKNNKKNPDKLTSFIIANNNRVGVAKNNMQNGAQKNNE